MRTQNAKRIGGGGRRGSVLILVVGVLALIATVVIVYTTVGQTDKRAGANTLRTSQAQEQAQAVGSYLAGLIAEGQFKYVNQLPLSGQTDEARAVRVPMDYPGVDPLAVAPSDATATGNTLALFGHRTDGKVVEPWRLNGPDPRIAADPWLATALPERLRITNAAGGLTGNPEAVPVDPTMPWRDVRDWRSISNPAPGGMFVNLVNLRNNFGAEPGVGQAADGKPRMTSGLTLLAPAYTVQLGSPTAPEQIPAATISLPQALPRWNGTALATRSTATDWAQNDPVVYRPADYTLNQVGLARPVRETRGSTARAALNRLYNLTPPDRIVPGDQEYFGNQYADADGDGLADSRWFEPVDATTLDSDGNPVAKALLPTGSPWRIFVAARIVDLSSKVNVNTATQFASPPTARFPAGATPADIDLERLLKMNDVAEAKGRVDTGGAVTPFALYDALTQPGAGNTPVEFRRGSTGASDPANYAAEIAYSFRTQGGWGYPDYLGNDDGHVHGLVGAASFAALLDARTRTINGPQRLQQALNTGETDLPNQGVAYPPLSGGGVARGFARERPNPFDALVDRFEGNQVNAVDRAELYRLSVSLGGESFGTRPNPGVADVPELSGLRNAFGLADELELRTFEGVNDATTLSRLEQTLSGRLSYAPNLDPLRSNRTSDLERLDRDRADNTDFEFDNGVAAQPTLEPDGFVDPDTALQAQIDLRRHLTTVSGARPLASADVTSNPGALSAAELASDPERLLSGISRAQRVVGTQTVPDWPAMQQGINSLFDAAVRTLMPFADEERTGESVWDGEPDAANLRNPARSLFYGGLRTVPGQAPKSMDYRGSPGEVASRLAAHWTANLIASRLRWSEPIPASGPPTAVEAADRPVMFTLLSGGQVPGGGSARAFVEQRTLYPAGDAARGTLAPAAVFPEWDAELNFALPTLAAFAPRVVGRLDLDAGRAVPTSGSGRVDRTAPDTVNPALHSPATRVFGITPQPFITQAASFVVYVAVDGGGQEKPRIRGSVSTSNTSYITEVLAVTLHNPFDVELSLGKVNIDGPTGRVVNAGATEEVQVRTRQSDLRYYLEFGGKTYAVAKESITTSGTLENIVLAPGASKTVYISDMNTEQMVERFRNAGVTVSELDVRAWLGRQMGTDADGVIRLPRVDPDLKQLTPATPAAGILSPSNPDTNLPNPDENRQVRLWQVVRTATETFSAGNNRRNDILVDRLRDPRPFTSSPTLDRRIRPSLTLRVADGNDQRPPNGGQILVRAGKIRRPADPAGARWRGSLPAYCIEVKAPQLDSGGAADPAARFDAGGGTPSVVSLNVEWQSGNALLNNLLDNGAVGEPEIQLSEFSAGNDFLMRSAALAVGSPTPGQHQDFRSITPPIPSERWDAHEPPTAYSTEAESGPPGSKFTLSSRRSLSGLQWREVRSGPNDPVTGQPRTWWTAGLEIPMLLPAVNQRSLGTAPGDGVRLGSAVTVARQFDPGTQQRVEAAPVPPPLRASDLMATLAVGPSHEPLVQRPNVSDPDDPRHLEAQWTTLAEAAALALDHDSPAQPTSGPVNPMYRIGAVDPRWFNASETVNEAQLVLGATVKGRLAFDRFVPFVDRASGGLVGSAPDGVFEAGADQVRGLGQPLAMGLLDALRPGVGGSLTRKVEGTVNVNTAPQLVQWTLPMAAPSVYQGDWPGIAESGTNPSRDRLVNPGQEWWDVTGTLLAYRDKDLADAGAWRLDNTNRGTSRGDRFTSRFVDADGASTEYGADSTAPAYAQNDPSTWVGRWVATGIPGLREAPGLASVGELLAVRQRELPTAAVSGLYAEVNDDRRWASVDRQARAGTAPRLAFMEQPTNPDGVYGVGGALHRRPVASVTDERQAFDLPEVPDAPTASQPIVDALLGTVSTRSDVFAAWFLVHGYTAADVEGLGPTDPMTPSLAKRYVMVVDRSNVVSSGDRPRVLLFREVPMR
jgi:hypothetical protein